MRMFLVWVSLLLYQVQGYAENEELKQGEWDYEFLTPQVVVLRSSFTKFLQGHFPKDITAFQEESVRKLSSASVICSEQEIVKCGYWYKENSLLRDRSGDILRYADTTHYFYIFFEHPLRAGESVNIQVDDVVSLKVHYNPEKPSNLFKLNQIGNVVSQEKKYAYLGAWCGTAGGLPLNSLEGKKFEIRSAADGKTVFANTIKMRFPDPAYQGKIPFTGEEVAELDYSEYNTPGEYYFYIPEIGRSLDFIMGPEAINEAFYIHARGLFHKRCGIAKTLPFTAWECPACHSEVIRGRFPDNAAHYRKGQEQQFGFFDRRDNRVEIKQFKLIQANPPYEEVKVVAPGGWHDAADYDRRPYHLRIVNDLSVSYLLKPENYIDNQLNIPESGNGIPDILDEAAWGLKHLLAVQQEDGGVGTWFETTGHPQPGEGLPSEDKYTYYVSAPSRNGTLEYAATASIFALALKRAGNDACAQIWQDSAIKAWEFAGNPKNRLIATFLYEAKVVFYREEEELAAENLLRAGLNLYVLTGEAKYLQAVVAEKPRIKESFNRDFWRWSPLSWMPLYIFPQEELADFLAEYQKVIVRNADEMLKQQECAYPYRVPWYGADAGWVHSMAWGNYHPLRRAMTLIAAHALTGNSEYLTGAYLANDFHNGANPSGMSMTSGLGKIYPAVFLDLTSYADDVSEFVPGITPYGNTFGIDRNAIKMVYGDRGELLPIWHRRVNLEFLSVPSSEYSVWETIGPAAAVTGYLIETPAVPTDTLLNKKPAGDFCNLPGYQTLP